VDEGVEALTEAHSRQRAGGMAEEHSAGAERAPLIDGDDEDDAAGADPNRLSWLDVAWLVLHAAGASCDGLALRALLRRRFKGALFFGGHTQFLGNWCLCLSIGTAMPRPRRAAPRAPRPSPRRPAPPPACPRVCFHARAVFARARLRRVRARPCVSAQPATPWPYTRRWRSRRRQRCTTSAGTSIETESTTGRRWPRARW